MWSNPRAVAKQNRTKVQSREKNHRKSIVCLFAWVCVCVFFARRVSQRSRGQLSGGKKRILSTKSSIWLGVKQRFVGLPSRDAQTHCTWLQQVLMGLNIQTWPGLSSWLLCFPHPCTSPPPLYNQKRKENTLEMHWCIVPSTDWYLWVSLSL